MYSGTSCSVHLYIVVCCAAEHIHVPGLGWAGLELGAWREFGGSSERDNRTNGASRCNAGRTQYTIRRLIHEYLHVDNV